MPDPQTPQDDTEQADDSAVAPAIPENDSLDDVAQADVGIFDSPLNLSQEDKERIISYLEENLPKMRPPEDEKRKIRSYFAMYEMIAKNRNFPYEGAPSLSSSDAHDATNEWLDQAETAFLMQRVTFTIDREETNLSEDKISRMEKTFHRKFFLKDLAPEARLILFEAGFLGASVTRLSETYDIIKTKDKIVIKDAATLAQYSSSLTKSQEEEAKEKISQSDIFAAEQESIRMENLGARVDRVDQTKFWFPRNSKSIDEWQIVSEVEYYTKSSLKEMASLGEVDSTALDKMIEVRTAAYANYFSSKDDPKHSPLPESVKYLKDMDSDWSGESAQIKQYGDTYDDEFAIYRVTLKYNVKTEKDPAGKLRSWIQVLYSPCGGVLLGSKFCQDGFPYFIIQRRHVPYKAMGPGIAQERYNPNLMDTELKSLFLASLEQEIGAPLMIRKGSGLYASSFRAYPASVAYTEDPQRDVAFLPFPQKSRLAVEGMTMVLGSSPSANRGAGYASGKREELMQGKDLISTKARIQSIAMDLDKVVNAAWKIFCRLSKFNTDKRKVIDWVFDEEPLNGKKLFILSQEMDPDLVWSSVNSAVSLTPDARLAEAMRKFQFFHQQVPVSVNDPELTINWLDYMANYFDLDENQRQKLLPTAQSFQNLQAQQAAQGGQNQQASGTSLTAQSPNTPFQRPAGPPQQSQGNQAPPQPPPQQPK